MEFKLMNKIIKSEILKLMKQPEYMCDQYKQQYNRGWNDALKELCKKLNIEL